MIRHLILIKQRSRQHIQVAYSFTTRVSELENKKAGPVLYRDDLMELYKSTVYTINYVNGDPDNCIYLYQLADPHIR